MVPECPNFGCNFYPGAVCGTGVTTFYENVAVYFGKKDKRQNMNAVKLNKLDAKLRELFEMSKQAEIRRSQRKNQSGVGNIIRRRKGKQDKRIVL